MSLLAKPKALLPDGIVAFVKRDCPTCATVEPVLRQLAALTDLTIYSQDDPSWPPGLDVIDDTSLEVSYGMDLQAVPTLLRVRDGHVRARVEGWLRSSWEDLTGLPGLGPGLPDHRPGCGSRTVEPGMAHVLAVRFGATTVRSRRVEYAQQEDDAEVCFEHGWTDGLPVIAPTEERVVRMLEGTTRPPDEVVAVVPPDMAPCTVEKVAVNAVLAGCRPAYLPVVLAAIEGACTDQFNAHGLLATTHFAGPIVVVNGPIASEIGMNSGGNCLGQGNRANATIGRALQLVIRNVGGGRPGGVDRSTLGNPGKYTFCFAENEADSPWEPLSVERGFAPGVSTVTLFAGEAPRGVADQLSRTPESLARTLASCLVNVAHPKFALAVDALLVVSPEHGRVFRDAGWSRRRLVDELMALCTRPADELLRGAGGCAEGLPEELGGTEIPKFRPGGILIVHAGGPAGMFSAIVGGWLNGETGSDPITVEVRQ